MPRTPKRRPGAQPGNTNALKHGFYSAAFGSDGLRTIFERAIEMHDWNSLQREAAVARTHLYRLIQTNPTNHEVLTRLLSVITRMMGHTFRLSRDEEGELGLAMAATLEQLLLLDPGLEHTP